MLTRDELTGLVLERTGDVTKLGEVLQFVDSVLQLQNDMTRPVYIFEVDPEISQVDIAYLDNVMNSLGVACALVPRDLMGYVGEVDSDSMGVKNFKETVYGIKPRGVE